MAKIWLDSIEKQKKKKQLELCVIDGQTDRHLLKIIDSQARRGDQQQ